MRVALLSDVHANLAALEAVLRDADAASCDAAWHLGDVVGYGPQPDEVVARLRELGAAGVLGNHDAAAAGLIGTNEFNDLAAEAARWTASRIGTATRAYLESLPPIVQESGYTLVHGTLRDPTWEYLTSVAAALAHFELQQTTHSIVGHTHMPLVVRETAPGEIEAITPEDGTIVDLDDTRTCLNPGGVGQPRDGDPRACYAILDTAAQSVSFHRVAYDIASTQRLMRELGLPEPLAARLAHGR